MKKTSASIALILTIVVVSVVSIRFGWWQTLHWGHVRPRWGGRCYGPVAYNRY